MWLHWQIIVFVTGSFMGIVTGSRARACVCVWGGLTLLLSC